MEKSEIKLIFNKGDGIFLKRILSSIKTNGCICLYFSAHWCKPCKEFTKLLTKFHKSTYLRKNTDEEMIIIFVSLDKNAETMIHYFKEAHGKWYAIPFSHSLREFMIRKYNVSSIPQLVVLDKKWRTITDKGVIEIREASKKNKSLHEVFIELYEEWIEVSKD